MSDGCPEQPGTPGPAPAGDDRAGDPPGGRPRARRVGLCPADDAPILEQQAAERGRTLGTGHADALAAENDLALSYLADAEQEQDALAQLHRLAADCAAALGPDHPDTLVVRGNLAVAQLAAGQADTAITALADVVADRTRVLGAGHGSTLNARVALSLALSDDGRPDAAGHLAATLAAVVARHGTRHPLARSCRALLDDLRVRPDG